MDKSVTSQDILNLANAYAVIRQNKSRDGGYKISDSYGDDILSALNLTTKKYIQQVKEDHNEN